MNKLFLPYDVYERHKKVAQFIKESDTVLDVGGELNHLSQFVKSKRIIVANLKTGDVIITKNKIPFSDNSFNVVCAIDVLEHIPKAKRGEFINKLVSISKSKVILSFPIGTEKHIVYEKEIQALLLRKGMSVAYLKEHIKYGLPERNEINIIIKNYSTKLFYSGNIKINEILFKMFLFDPKIKFVRQFVYYLKQIFNLCTNKIFYFILNNQQFTQRTNRAYLIIYKQKGHRII